MNDSLRTDVFVRYMPETIAVACIYLAARKLKEPLPKNPSWFEVLGVEEDDIKDCCYRMIQLYNKKKVIFLYFQRIYFNYVQINDYSLVSISLSYPVSQFKL